MSATWLHGIGKIWTLQNLRRPLLLKGPQGLSFRTFVLLPSQKHFDVTKLFIHLLVKVLPQTFRLGLNMLDLLCHGLVLHQLGLVLLMHRRLNLGESVLQLLDPVTFSCHLIIFISFGLQLSRETLCHPLFNLGFHGFDIHGEGSC